MSQVLTVSKTLGSAIGLTVLAATACSDGDDGTLIEQELVEMTIQLTSSAFTEGSDIPETFTCDAEDVSPPLKWSGTPDETRSIALVVDDPDAPGGTWVHWVLYRVPPDAGELPGEAPSTEVTLLGARNGKNDFGRLGYGGPCPPLGDPHRYFFKLYALDIELELESGATREELLNTMDGHILAIGQLMGRYQRQ